MGEEKREMSKRSFPLTTVFGYLALTRLYNPFSERKS